MTARMLIGLVTVIVTAAAGCKKQPVAATAPPPTQPAAPGPAPVDQRNTNFQAGAGAVQNVRKAGMRTITINDLQQLGQFVEISYNELGKMPDAARIKQDLNPQAGNILKAIDEGAILLTGTKNHAGLWAYEVDADKVGGVVLVGGTARRAEADEVKQLLAQK